ncbi:uncharacterized protein LOC141489573 [Macrotis lagotis]|uniref:uncharacterized protein LOC141489573 n=1 Tax=Macrotis lagotis TaxID=92651 RepID=UPI003D695B0E
MALHTAPCSHSCGHRLEALQPRRVGNEVNSVVFLWLSVSSPGRLGRFYSHFADEEMETNVAEPQIFVGPWTPSLLPLWVASAQAPGKGLPPWAAVRQTGGLWTLQVIWRGLQLDQPWGGSLGEVEALVWSTQEAAQGADESRSWGMESLWVERSQVGTNLGVTRCSRDVGGLQEQGPDSESSPLASQLGCLGKSLLLFSRGQKGVLQNPMMSKVSRKTRTEDEQEISQRKGKEATGDSNQCCQNLKGGQKFWLHGHGGGWYQPAGRCPSGMARGG